MLLAINDLLVFCDSGGNFSRFFDEICVASFEKIDKRKTGKYVHELSQLYEILVNFK